MTLKGIDAGKECLNVEEEYRRIEASALSAWDANPGMGSQIGLGYVADLLGFSSGSKFSLFEALRQFMDELNRLSQSVEGLDILAERNLHFTFLALSQHRYSGADAFPENLSELKRVAKESLKSAPTYLSRLRLVPLSNAIVLAGVPDEESVSARAVFTEALLKSSWAPHLRQRYGQYSIPPLIWHTTLVRADRQYLPTAVRDLFHSWRRQDFGSLELDAPRVAAVTYNWSRMIEIT